MFGKINKFLFGRRVKQPPMLPYEEDDFEVEGLRGRRSVDDPNE